MSFEKNTKESLLSSNTPKEKSDEVAHKENDEIVRKVEERFDWGICDIKRWTRTLIMFLIFLDILSLVFLSMTLGQLFKHNKC